MNGKGSIRVTKTKVLQVRSEDAMDNGVSPLSGERFREGLRVVLVNDAFYLAI